MWSALVETTCLNKSASYNEYIVCSLQSSLQSLSFFFSTFYIDCFFSRPTDNIGFSYVRRKLNSCLFKQSVSTHNVKLAEMRAIYDKVTIGLAVMAPVAMSTPACTK